MQEERKKASMRKRMNTTGGEERWFLAPGTHMNAFQVGCCLMRLALPVGFVVTLQAMCGSDAL